MRISWNFAACLVVLAVSTTAAAGNPADDLIDVPGGTFVKGDADGEVDEAPREVTVAPFRLMRLEVSNAQFSRFVAETGHVTDPERRGWAWVWTGRWNRVDGADWRHPEGPDDSIDGRSDHPAVQISKDDGEAFCAHYGMRLPTDTEWEFAARGTDGRQYPWGNQPPEAEDGSRLANFGSVPCCAPNASDGFLTTSPVGTFPEGASPFGLLDMAGNVWEWTSDIHPGEPGEFAIRGGGWGNNPYCLRVSYRHGNPPKIGLDMVGLRCAADAE